MCASEKAAGQSKFNAPIQEAIKGTRASCRATLQATNDSWATPEQLIKLNVCSLHRLRNNYTIQCDKSWRRGGQRDEIG